MLKPVLIGSLSLALLFSQGLSHTEAKGKTVKKHTKKTTVVDKNKDGIPDKWESGYKLGLKKDVWKKDTDKDGLNNVTEYKLKLNPVSADTDHDGIKDGSEDSDGDGLSNKTELTLKLNPGLSDSNHNKIKDADEDFDKDGLSNLSEIELKLNPANADSDHDHVKDGVETGKDGVKQINEVRSFNLQAKTGHKKEIQIQFKKMNGKDSLKIKDKTGKITLDMAKTLVADLHASPGLTADTIVNEVKSVFQLDDSYQLKVDIEYFNGKDLEVNKEVSQDEVTGNENDDQQAALDPEDGADPENGQISNENGTDQDNGQISYENGTDQDNGQISNENGTDQETGQISNEDSTDQEAGSVTNETSTDQVNDQVND
jgi:hypothetical protein